MTDKFVEKTCIEFADLLASGAPVPGGGGVAAFMGALGSALCSMTGNLTKGKKKYARYEADILSMIEESEKIRHRLMELVDEDAEAFKPLQEAYSVPADDPNKRDVMVKASMMACQAPMEMIRCICSEIDIIDEMRVKCSQLMLSDVVCAASCCKAALECAAVSVFANTSMMPADLADKIELECDTLLRRYIPAAEEIVTQVYYKIRG